MPDRLTSGTGFDAADKSEEKGGVTTDTTASTGGAPANEHEGMKGGAQTAGHEGMNGGVMTDTTASTGGAPTNEHEGMKGDASAVTAENPGDAPDIACASPGDAPTIEHEAVNDAQTTGYEGVKGDAPDIASASPGDSSTIEHEAVNDAPSAGYEGMNGDDAPVIASASPGDFTQGSVAGRIIRLAAPITLAQLVNLLYNIVDRIWLGRWQGEGPAALAGVGLAFPVIAIITAFTSLASTGAVPLFNIARGAGERDRAGRIMGNAFSSLFALALAITAAGLTFRRPILYLVGASDGTIGYADSYLSVYLCGTFFAMCGLGMNGFINAQGYGRVGMFTVLLGAVVNIILDPILIFSFGMGITGAALATVIAQGCSAAWAIAFLRGRRASVPLRREWLRPSSPILRRSFALGLAGFTMATTNSLVAALYNMSLRDLGGDLYISVMVIIHSIQEIIALPGGGLSSGAQPVISYNYGAGRNDRVRRSMRFLSIASLSIFILLWSAVMLFPEALIRVFSDDAALIETGVVSVRAFFVVFFLMAFQSIGQAGFVSLGLTKYAIFFSVLRKGALVIPFVLILGYALNLGPLGVLYAEPVSHVFGSVTCYVVFMLAIYRKRLKK